MSTKFNEIWFRKCLRDYHNGLGDEFIDDLKWERDTFNDLADGNRMPTILELVQFCNCIEEHPAEFF